MPWGKDYPCIPTSERSHKNKKRKLKIQDLIAEGEHEQQDFKYQISDARKIARSISAFANHNGGHLLIGVKDNGKIAGVSSDEEIYMVEQAAQLYCRPAQQVKFSIYHVAGKAVVKADIAPATQKPVLAPDENGKYRAYFRVADENILASRIHTLIMQDEQNEDEGIIRYDEHERVLISYLREHGGITLRGYMRLAHITQATAERSIRALHHFGILDIHYHDAQCLFTLASI